MAVAGGWKREVTMGLRAGEWRKQRAEQSSGSLTQPSTLWDCSARKQADADTLLDDLSFASSVLALVLVLGVQVSGAGEIVRERWLPFDPMRHLVIV